MREEHDSNIEPGGGGRGSLRRGARGARGASPTSLILLVNNIKERSFDIIKGFGEFMDFSL